MSTPEWAMGEFSQGMLTPEDLEDMQELDGALAEESALEVLEPLLLGDDENGWGVWITRG